MPVLDPHRWSSVLSSLGVTLFLWFFTAVLAAFSFYTFVSVRATTRQWHETVQSGALAWSELIQQATHQGMLLNRNEEVHQIIHTVARTPGVVGVRIYGPQGVVMYSGEPREIGRRADIHAEACGACHQGGGSPRESLTRRELVRVYRGPDGHRVLGLINPIENSPACANGPCHAHPPDQKILGVLDVTMSLAEEDRSLTAARRLSVTSAGLLVLAVGGSSALFIRRFVRRPIRSLIAGAQRVAQGDLAARFEVESRNELGQLAAAFNHMTRELAAAQRENEEWSRELESRVTEKAEKLAHTQKQVVHMEKMASLGTLAATVAHELNNPLAGILNYAKLVDRSLAEGAAAPGPPEGEREEIRGFLRIIQQEANRCGQIVRNFLLFARRTGGALALHNLNPVFDQSLAILRHHLEMRGVKLAWTPMAGDDRIVCDAGQIQQALLDLFVNAVEAMPEGGVLTVAAREAGEAVEIEVTDTGVGITGEAMPHIFEPFYTTKEKSGSGLGLSVVYGIVERHGGTIEVDSTVGKGTTFRLRLPRHHPEGPESPQPETERSAS